MLVVCYLLLPCASLCAFGVSAGVSLHGIPSGDCRTAEVDDTSLLQTWDHTISHRRASQQIDPIVDVKDLDEINVRMLSQRSSLHDGLNLVPSVASSPLLAKLQDDSNMPSFEPLPHSLAHLPREEEDLENATSRRSMQSEKAKTNVRIIDDEKRYRDLAELPGEWDGFQIGERVECRFSSSNWIEGTVKSVSPLKVERDGSGIAIQWDRCRGKREGAAAVASPDTEFLQTERQRRFSQDVADSSVKNAVDQHAELLAHRFDTERQWRSSQDVADSSVKSAAEQHVELLERRFDTERLRRSSQDAADSSVKNAVEQNAELLERRFDTQRQRRSSQDVADSFVRNAVDQHVDLMARRFDHLINEQAEKAVRGKAEIEKRAEHEVAHIISRANEEVRQVSLKAKEEMGQNSLKAKHGLLMTDTSFDYEHDDDHDDDHNDDDDDAPEEGKECCVIKDKEGKDDLCYKCTKWHKMFTIGYKVPVNQGIFIIVGVLVVAPFSISIIGFAFEVAKEVLCVLQIICCVTCLLLVLFVYVVLQSGAQWLGDLDLEFPSSNGGNAALGPVSS